MTVSDEEENFKRQVSKDSEGDDLVQWQKGEAQKGGEQIVQSKPLARSVFPWVTSKLSVSEVPLAFETVTAEEVVREYGVPRGIIIGYLQEEIKETKACYKLTFTLLLVLTVSCTAISRFNVPSMRAVEESVEILLIDKADIYDGTADIPSVREFAEVWSFLNVGLTGFLFTREPQYSDDFNESHVKPLDKSEIGLMAQYNRVVGGVRLRQQRYTNTKCDRLGDSYLGWLVNSTCYHSNLRNYHMEPELLQKTAMDADEQYTEWIWLHEPELDVASKLSHLELDGWLDYSTQKVEVGIPIYNAEFGTHTYVTVNFIFPTTGHIWKSINSKSCYAVSYSTWGAFFWDTLFLLFFVSDLVAIGGNMYRTVREHGFTSIWEDYANFRTVIEWTSILGGIGLMLMWVEVLKRTRNLNIAADAMNLSRRSEDGVIIEDTELAEDYMGNLELTTGFFDYLRRSSALYPLVLVCRLFMSFEGQPRMALVTKSIKVASGDLFHFMLIFVSVFLTFTVSGVIVFGRDIEEFATIGRGMGFCLRFLLGEFNPQFDAMELTLSMWMVLFSLIQVMVMMNILLAIIMGAYSEVKHACARAETLWEESQQMYQRKKGELMGTHVAFKTVLKALQLDERQIKKENKKRAERARQEREEKARHDDWDIEEDFVHLSPNALYIRRQTSPAAVQTPQAKKKSSSADRRRLQPRDYYRPQSGSTPGEFHGYHKIKRSPAHGYRPDHGYLSINAPRVSKSRELEYGAHWKWRSEYEVQAEIASQEAGLDGWSADG